MGQIETNLVSAFLCCRAAVQRDAQGRGGGRIVNVAARPALEPRTGAEHDGLYGEQGRRRGADAGARRGSRQGRHSGERGRALDHGHAGQPQRDAEGGFRRLAEGRGGRGDDPVSRLAGECGDARRDRAGVREARRQRRLRPENPRLLSQEYTHAWSVGRCPRAGTRPHSGRTVGRPGARRSRRRRHQGRAQGPATTPAAGDRRSSRARTAISAPPISMPPIAASARSSSTSRARTASASCASSPRSRTC